MRSQPGCPARKMPANFGDATLGITKGSALEIP
jgi:hypothetical protein